MAIGDLSVFGGTGFVGSRFCSISTRKCIKIARDKRTPATEEILYFISTTDNYHVFDNTKIDIETNLLILMEVLDQMKSGGGVINFISSWFVYGETKLPAKENSLCRPKGFYSITKYAAEEMLKSYCRIFNINYRILRLCNVYGKSDKNVSKKKNALQYLISQLQQNKNIDLYNDGMFYRDYMYVDDVCYAIELCINEAPLDCTINIGSGDKILFRDIIDIAKDKLGSTSKYIAVEPPKFHTLIQVKDFYMDTKKLKSLGFVQNISIEEGVRALCSK